MRLHLLVTYIILSISVTTTFSQSMDSLITAFDHQKGTLAVQTAKEIFRFLDEDDFTDGPVEIISGSSADSVKALTWYWASEWYYDAQRYDAALSNMPGRLSKRREGSKMKAALPTRSTLSQVFAWPLSNPRKGLNT